MQTHGTSRGREPTPTDRLETLRDDYHAYCLGENADPAAYVARLQELLERQKELGTGHPDQLTAMGIFLDEITADEVEDV